MSRIPGTDKLLMVWTPNYAVAKRHMGSRNTLAICVSEDGGRSWPHARRKVLHDPKRAADYPSVLFRTDEIWITLRTSAVTGGTGTALMRVPLTWLEP